MDYITSMRNDIELLLDKGSSYTITHYNRASEDVWGKTDTTGSDSTEDLYIIRKYYGHKNTREGVKEVEYIVLIARYTSVLEIGDKISISGDSYWIEGIQSATIENDATIFKRVRAIKEEFA
jgi:hypothetical protein